MHLCCWGSESPVIKLNEICCSIYGFWCEVLYGTESSVECWEDVEDEYLARAANEYMQLNEDQVWSVPAVLRNVLAPSIYAWLAHVLIGRIFLGSVS